MRRLVSAREAAILNRERPIILSGASRPAASPTSHVANLMGLIPGEVIAGFALVNGLVRHPWGNLVCAVVTLLCTAAFAYLPYRNKPVPSGARSPVVAHVLLASGAFIIWLAVLNAPLLRLLGMEVAGDSSVQASVSGIAALYSGLVAPVVFAFVGKAPTK